MILLHLAQSAAACGPGFPDRLLDDRAATLLELPAGTFMREAASLVAAPADELPVDSGGDRDAHEQVGLTAEQWATVRAMRIAPDADAAWALGAALPEELRLYTAGAVAWAHDDWVDGRERFLAVLALPAPERQLRGVWAAYNLAEPRAGWRWEPGWAGVRELARSGAADPEGLAVASLGEEARVHLRSGQLAPAVALYAEQAARGSESGAASLLRVARAIADEGDPAPLADPLIRRLMATYAWTRSGELDETSPAAWKVGPNGLTVEVLLRELERRGPVEGAGQAAALAYDHGDYALAARWVALEATPLSAWVRAKLALREGRLEDAALAYAEAAPGFPLERLAEGDRPEHALSACRLQEERGALALARGEYVEALGVLLDAARAGADTGWGGGTGWEDAAWVAERVLTVDELRAYVDRPSPDDAPTRRLRALLARRLVREGRVADAAPYFADPELRAAATAYADALHRGGSPIERARGLLEAGRLARPGLYLLGTEVHPDYAVFDGSYERDPPPAEGPWLGPGEPERVLASAPAPDLRYHYREVAKDHALAAADLLPTTSQAYVVALCEAASYVRNTDPETFRALWERYVATAPPVSMTFGVTCPAPDWPNAERRAAEQRPRIPVAVGVALAAVGVLGLAWAVRRLR